MRKRPLFLLLATIIISGTGFFINKYFPLLNNSSEGIPAVLVKCGPTPPWIEVYHDGELTSEWQPSDGEIYRFLMDLLEDNLYVPVQVEPIEYGTTLATVF